MRPPEQKAMSGSAILPFPTHGSPDPEFVQGPGSGRCPAGDGHVVLRSTELAGAALPPAPPDFDGAANDSVPSLFKRLKFELQ